MVERHLIQTIVAGCEGRGLKRTYENNRIGCKVALQSVFVVVEAVCLSKLEALEIHSLCFDAVFEKQLKESSGQKV